MAHAWPKNLIITTDGSCGSACAAFVAKMTKLGSAKIVAIGGDTMYSADTFVSYADDSIRPNWQLLHLKDAHRFIPWW